MAKDDPQNKEITSIDFILIKNYKIKYMEDPQRAGHYIPIAEITPSSYEEKKALGDSIIMVLIPSFSELGNYTDWPIKYNLLLQTSRGRHYWQTRDRKDNKFLTDVIIFPVSKQIGEYDVSVGEGTEGFQILDGSQLPGDNYKILKSEDGNSSIGVGDNTIVFRSGETMATITPKQVTVNGKMVNLNLPNANYVVGEETGFLDLMPKCFLPVFNHPRLMPKIDLFVAAGKLLDIVSSIKKGD